MVNKSSVGLAPIFPDTFYRLTHYWFAAADIPVANDIPVHCADAIRCNVRRPPQGSLPLLTRQVWHDTDVVALHRFHEALRHSVAFWTTYRRMFWLQSYHSGELTRLMRTVG